MAVDALLLMLPLVMVSALTAVLPRRLMAVARWLCADAAVSLSVLALSRERVPVLVPASALAQRRYVAVAVDTVVVEPTPKSSALLVGVAERTCRVWEAQPQPVPVPSLPPPSEEQA